MTNLMNRMKSSLRRVGDWVTGSDVPVAVASPDPELLENRPTLRPNVDVLESAHEVVFVADVPGAHSDSARIFVDGDRLTLRCCVPAITQATLLLGTAMDADWYAQWALPRGIDGERVHASLRDGVLTVRLPKHEAAAPRRIAITSHA